ncbi:class I SAM-dependent methyltransferase [Paenibacillus silvisoli]|uniref:class I SAM-dependent methyltransferase n=1 Tax=Paenibacillus silvisoli TaxID=3110539 RepID=UPI0028055F3B|nr:class I SAM-dependent methyltransferase [Paenibacillus silvisoli]
MANWYERSFGADYMIVYRHRNWEQAAREVETMAGWLELPQGAAVLDIGCGMGRHALALALLGYEVTGIDLSDALLQKAREHNSESRIRSLVQGDMRELPFADGSFDATVNLFTSFGYFEDEADNQRVLNEIRRVLKPQGAFLIDFMNPVYVKEHLVPHSERIDAETGNYISERRTAVDGWVVKQIEISERDRPESGRRYEERVRLFPLSWFEQALAAAGLQLERCYGDYEGRSYDERQSPRMILKGRAVS